MLYLFKLCVFFLTMFEMKSNNITVRSLFKPFFQCMVCKQCVCLMSWFEVNNSMSSLVYDQCYLWPAITVRVLFHQICFGVEQQESQTSTGIFTTNMSSDCKKKTTPLRLLTAPKLSPRCIYHDYSHYGYSNESTHI